MTILVSKMAASPCDNFQLLVDTTSTSAGNILIEGATGTSDGTTTTVTLEAAVAGMGTDIGNVTIDGSGGVTLNGSITTAGGNIDINDAVTLDTADIILTTQWYC